MPFVGRSGLIAANKLPPVQAGLALWSLPGERNRLSSGEGTKASMLEAAGEGRDDIPSVAVLRPPNLGAHHERSVDRKPDVSFCQKD